MKYTRYLLIAVVSVSIVLFQNCSEVSLSEMSQSSTLAQSGLKIEHCSDKARKLESKLKFIFIVDRSHSNQCKDAGDVNCQYGTDPMGDRRFSPILELVEQYRPNGQNDSLVYWSLVNFNSESEIAGEFTNDSGEFKNFIGHRRGDNVPGDLGQYGRTGQIDSGSTNYLRALDSAKKLIVDDIDAAKDLPQAMSSTYVVFFISDGEPNELRGNVYVPQDPKQINSGVESIIDLGEDDRVYVDGIQFNTAFYYEEFNATARSLLTTMSVKGKGAYAEFGAGEGIDFNRFRIPSRQLRFDLKELWVINNNVIWKENRMIADSDGDYLADEDEISFGSDPYNSDSDGNSVRDGIENKIWGVPCQLSGCRAAAPPVICSGYIGTDGKFSDLDGDQLNSCEEVILGTLPNNYDSNGDTVPDSVGLRYDYPIIKDAANELYLDRDSDGINNYRELKDGTNYKIPNNQISNFKKMSYTTVKIFEDSVNACYEYNVVNLPAIGAMNQVTVFVLEGTQFVSQKLELRSVTKSIKTAGSVTIRNTEFQ